MATYQVAHLDELDELIDGTHPFRPGPPALRDQLLRRHHWTARAAGDRLLNEHDEQDVGEDELFFDDSDLDAIREAL